MTGSLVVNWPILPVKKFLQVKGKNEFYLKIKDTSENLIPQETKSDGPVEYQLFYNKASKLIGYRFNFSDFEHEGEILPRVTLFGSSVMASYVPKKLVLGAPDGDLFAFYHDLHIRLIRYNLAPTGATYCALLRSRFDQINGD